MKEILEWSDDLYGSPQDDLVIPDQLWLAGFCVMKGVVRQFVAMPFGGRMLLLAVSGAFIGASNELGG